MASVARDESAAGTSTSDYCGCLVTPALPDTGPGKRAKREPKNARLQQQAHAACKPVLDAVWVVFILLAITVVLVPIGAVCLSYGIQPGTVSARYDTTCFNDSSLASATNEARQQAVWAAEASGTSDSALSCTVELVIEKDMNAPVYLFYKVYGLYQNNYRYVQSRSYQQLVGQDNAYTGTCDPQLYYGGNESRIINPCGLAPWTLFNDTFQLSVEGLRGGAPQPLPLQTAGIASASDVKYLYGDYMAQWFNPRLNDLRGGGNLSAPIDQSDQLMIWLRLAPLAGFYKLWGVVGRDLKAGERVLVNVVNRYNTFQFNGRKEVVLATSSWLGTYNPVIGSVLLATGGLSALSAIVYLAFALSLRRENGDLLILTDADWARLG
ncbi:hypothetical protein FOA52_001072 [Chlamydomonas sp. UWO 241]|nr:hypothetical protein FOA52_001072 [Chlamydomonas sp. UWO 241]